MTGQAYAQCLQTYEASSNQRAAILKWFGGKALFDLPQDRFDVLSIGCGAGELDRNILAMAQQTAKSLSYVGLEPDARQCQRFLVNMQEGLPNTTEVEVHNQLFEDLQIEREFDLALMVHSLYYMADPAVALDKALRLVRNGGKLIVMIAANDQLNELSSSFWAVEQARTAWFSEDVARYLRRRGFSFTQSCIDARLNISSCWDQDSSRGQQILNFLTQAVVDKLSPQLQQMIMTYLDAIAERDGEMRWLKHSVDTFCIEASAAPDKTTGVGQIDDAALSIRERFEPELSTPRT